MKLLSIIAAGSLSLLAAQAEAAGPVAQAIALHSGIAAIHHNASSEIARAPGLSEAKPDVVTTRGGTQYLSIHAGDGTRQTNTSFVVCHPCQGGGSKDCCAVGCD